MIRISRIFYAQGRASKRVTCLQHLHLLGSVPRFFVSFVVVFCLKMAEKRFRSRGEEMVFLSEEKRQKVDASNPLDASVSDNTGRLTPFLKSYEFNHKIDTYKCILITN